MKILIFFLFSSLLLFVFIFILFVLNFSFILNSQDKGSPFECGFVPITFLNFTFSMPFFVISLMFLLFDVEIMVVCFYPFFSFSTFLSSSVIYFILFIILVSTLFEWLKGILLWF